MAEEVRYHGLSVNPGTVVAHVCLYSVDNYNRSVAHKHITQNDIKSEYERFELARDGVAETLAELAKNASNKIGDAESKIFLVQAEILNDPNIINKIKHEIEQNLKSADWALFEVYDEYENLIKSIQNPYFSDRSNDLVEIRNLLINKLLDNSTGFKCEGFNHCSRGEDKIIVASELTAEMMVNMNLNRVHGIITEHGGIASHAAIIARSVGVPAICGVRDIFDKVRCGSQILLNGDTGEVILNPSDETIANLLSIQIDIDKETNTEISPPGIQILANASLIDDIQHTHIENADGIGLFRTELFLMRKKRLLSEDEQFDYYKKVVEKMKGKPVTFRLLDIGGDKELPYLGISKESNPFLGLRGARFLLQNKEIFHSQLKALLRLSTIAPVKIMFPMVIDSIQMAELLRISQKLMKQVDCIPENLSFGAMFEVPSAFLDAEAILAMSDFGSIGSNDLIQYLFAVDRNNDMVSMDYNPEHPMLWKFLEEFANIAKSQNKEISICGEMAGRTVLAARLINIGITSLSVSPLLVKRIRNAAIKAIANQK